MTWTYSVVCISGARTGWESRQILQTCKSNLPPTLSDGSGIQLGVKSDLLACPEDFSQPKSEVPPTSCIVLDAAVIPVAEARTAKTFNEYVP